MNYHSISNLFHIFVTGPLIIAGGILRKNSPDWLQWTLWSLVGIVVIVQSSLWIMKRVPMWVALLHILIVAPIIAGALIYQSRWLYELMILIGAAAIGYHAITFIRYL
jgi:hypothetical protein